MSRFIFCRRVEHKTNENDEDDTPYKSLPFYGGAKGKFLLIHPSGRTSITNRNPSFYGIKGENEDEDEENVGMESEDNSDENEQTNTTNGQSTDESVCVGLPPDNAAVAEAKPVGLAVAGPGGVASSKPHATAVVGPQGLAVAKPVATAIAGVSGAESLVGLGTGKKKHNERPHKVGTNSTGQNTANKTKEEQLTFGAGRSLAQPSPRSNVYDYEHSSNVRSAAYNLLYIPVYLPNKLNE